MEVPLKPENVIVGPMEHLSTNFSLKKPEAERLRQQKQRQINKVKYI